MDIFFFGFVKKGIITWIKKITALLWKLIVIQLWKFSFLDIESRNVHLTFEEYIYILKKILKITIFLWKFSISFENFPPLNREIYHWIKNITAPLWKLPIVNKASKIFLRLLKRVLHSALRSLFELKWSLLFPKNYYLTSVLKIFFL